MTASLVDRLYGGVGHFAALQTLLEARDRYADLGRMILVCDFDDVALEGALSPVCYSVGVYEEDDRAPVDLRAAARERAELLQGFAGSGS